MPLSSVIWFQGEADSGSASYYACAQPAMIESWRAYFANPAAFFGFVVLEPWTGGAPDLPEFRDAQLGSLVLPYTGYAVATDIGDPTGPFGSVHPRCVGRAGRAAHSLELQATPPLPSPARVQQQEARRAAPRQRGAERAVRLARSLPRSQRHFLHGHGRGHGCHCHGLLRQRALLARRSGGPLPDGARRARLPVRLVLSHGLGRQGLQCDGGRRTRRKDSRSDGGGRGGRHNGHVELLRVRARVWYRGMRASLVEV